MNRTLILIWKELLTVLRDRKVRLSILLPPLVQLCIFTFGATLDVKNVPIGLLNRDAGEQGFLLVEKFWGTPIFNRQITFLKGVQEIGPFMDAQKGLMVVSIDEQFSRNLNAGNPTSIQLIFDGRKTNTAQIVAGYAEQIIRQFNAEYLAQRNCKIQNIQLESRTWFNPNRLYFWYNIPCLVGVLSMLTCLVVTTQSIARERELGTLDQLLVSPLVSIEILIGKIVPGILIGFLEGILMLSVGTLLFKVPFTGSFLLYIVSLILFVSAMSGVGLLISSLSATQQQAMLGTFIFMIPSVLLSGFATPIENMPNWLQPVTKIIPLTYMLIISKGIFLKAMPLRIVLENLWPLCTIGLFNLVGAGLFFKRRLR